MTAHATSGTRRTLLRRCGAALAATLSGTLVDALAAKSVAALAGKSGAALAATLAASSISPASAQTPMARQLRFTLTLINPLPQPLPGQRLWCYLPAELPPNQQLQQVQVSMPHQIDTDADGHRILALHWAELPPLAQRIVSVSLSVVAGPDAPVSLPDPARWLGAERHIESDDARLIRAARTLQRATPLQTAQAIYDWVQQHMHYAGYLADDLGALHALTRASGDCTEYAFLAVALARALGIPARMVGGYVQSQDTILRAQDYHNWAELYLDQRWQVLDAQKGQFLPAAGQYVAFRLYRAQQQNPVGQAHRWQLAGQMQVIW